jgi:hypothetical protein
MISPTPGPQHEEAVLDFDMLGNLVFANKSRLRRAFIALLHVYPLEQQYSYMFPPEDMLFDRTPFASYNIHLHHKQSTPLLPTHTHGT